MHIVIPARYGSTRLPGKPLINIAGKPVVQHVYERASTCTDATVYVATDDDRIRDAVEKFGGQVIMTSPEHESGTERLGEVITALELDDNEIVVNLQGDEPLMPESVIRQVSESLSENQSAQVATPCHQITTAEEINNPNVVKVIFDRNFHALYFSRSAIPFRRDITVQIPDTDPGGKYYRHIGLYAYRAGFVKKYTSLTPCALEKVEALEQLRVLWHGYTIAVCICEDAPGPGIDTPEDVVRVERLMSKSL